MCVRVFKSKGPNSQYIVRVFKIQTPTARARRPAATPHAIRRPDWYVAQGGTGASFLKSARRSKDMVGATSDRVRATISRARGPVGHQVAKLRFLDNWVVTRTTSAFAQLILAQTCNRATSFFAKCGRVARKLKAMFAKCERVVQIERS